MDRIAILGTGAVGSALASLARGVGVQVAAGAHSPGAGEFGFEAAAGSAELVILALPFTAMAEALPPLRGALTGKIVVDVSNALGPDWSPLDLGGGSAGEVVARLLPDARVVKAFNTVFADVMTPQGLARGDRRVTAFIASDDRDAADVVASLAGRMGFDPVVSGALRTARYLEAMAHLNIAIAVGEGGGTGAAFRYDRR